MSIVYLLSVFLKGIGAVLEILTQVFITKTMGLEDFGTYSTWVSAADLILWLLFSGIIRCNTYYLAETGTNYRAFRNRYYLRYVLPVIGVLTVGCALFGRYTYSVICLIALFELLMLDQSSTLLARHHSVKSLFGEYILGRIVFLVCFAGIHQTAWKKLPVLLVLYLLQYAVIIVFFGIGKKDSCERDVSETVSLRKWGQYQRADIVMTTINQLPVLIQYFFSGSGEAAMVSIVLLVKKLINFISGPTSKIFLPEFSRFYQSGEHEKIGDCYALIMRIQMLLLAPLSVVLLGFPQIVLSLFAEELLEYRTLFMICSAAFLISASMGPGFGVMQMTGNEKYDNLFREIGLVLALLCFVFFRGNAVFVLYGMMVQTLFESVGKYIFVCVWLKKMPTPLYEYGLWWLLPAAVIAAVSMFRWNESFPIMIAAAGTVGIIYLILNINTVLGLKNQHKKEE